MIHERIKTVRDALSLSQEAFGHKVGLTRSAISKLEKESRTLTDQTAKLICNEFGVNEEWLRTGKGDMFNSVDDLFELMGYRAKNLSPRGEKLMKHMLLMTNDELDALYEFARKLVCEDDEVKEQAGE